MVTAGTASIWNPPIASSCGRLLDRGVVYVYANLRGGGEFGEAWHRAGMLTKKQNVFDDFAAAARRLIELRYTTPARLAIEGGSNGGLLMGAALTQHPDSFARLSRTSESTTCCAWNFNPTALSM